MASPVARSDTPAECAVVCPDGQVLRLVDDDGPAAAEWVLLDPRAPGRSLVLTLPQAVERAGSEASTVLWSALCLRLSGGASSPAVVGLGDCELSEAQRFWANWPAPVSD
jgi:hypothetical protein